MWADGGVGAFYRGLPVALTGVVVFKVVSAVIFFSFFFKLLLTPTFSQALHMGGYDTAKSHLHADASVWLRLAVAQAITTGAGTLCFPFDTVKIDRSFVADMAHNEETPVVLRSIIRLAHDLDMSVVAEGVETQVEASSLRGLKCEFAQGFLFGAPMNASAAYNFIAANTRGGAPAPRGLPRPGSSPARIPRKL
jgi:hypothetical protein